jgi:hypothetical protein
MDASIPSELVGSLPRNLRTTGSGIYLMFLASACLIFAAAAAAWGIYSTVQQTSHRSALRRDGATATGRITRVRREKNSYTVYYEFTVEGTSYSGHAEMPWQLRNSVEQSPDSLPIRYLPAQPEVNHPAAWEWSFFFWIPLSTDLIHLPDFSHEFEWLMASVLSAILGVPLFLSLLSERRLLAEGVAASGTVTKCTAGSRGGYWLKYEFRTEDGRAATGKSVGRPREVGANLCVLYLRENPQRNQAYPTPNFRVAS